MLQKKIIFFHGYGSSPQAEKFKKLVTRFGTDNVFAFAANLDPQIAQPEVLAHIQHHIRPHQALANEPVLLILVGSSMGCWLASRMCDSLRAQSPSISCRLILINPCLDPWGVLNQYEQQLDLLAKYTAIEPLPIAHYFISRHDEVLDHSATIQLLNGTESITIDELADHRFNGSEFEMVLDYIAGITEVQSSGASNAPLI